MIRYAALVALLLLAILPGAVRASVSDAREALERSIAELDRADSLSGSQREAELERLADRLRRDPSLGVGAWLAEPLERPQPDLPLTRTRLTGALDALGPPIETAGLDARRQALQSVIQGPPFETRDLKSFTPDWLVPLVLVLEWLARVVGNMIRWPFDRFDELLRAFINGPLFFPIVSAAALAAVASLFLLYRRGLRAALVSEADLASLSIDLPPTSAEVVERAQRLAADGRYRDACHFMFLSALLWIEERGQTRFERSATNWEHLQRLDRQSPLVAPFRRLVDRFDRLWYGQADVSATDYRELEELALRVRRAAA